MLGISGEAKPVPMGAAGGGSGPLAPVGAGGGGGPMTHANKGKTEEKTKDALVSPTALTYNDDDDEGDDW